MAIEDIIQQFGLEKAIKSIFSDLVGIDLSKVRYDKESEQSNPVDYMTSDIDGAWYFGIGSMPMVFKAVSKKNEEIELNKLLLSNQISFDDKYNITGDNNIDFWNGKGFKIEKATINNVTVLLITNANVIPKSSQSFNTTSLAKPLEEELEWIEGFEVVYDAETISKKNKSLSNFINVPILFKENLDYILISVQTSELAEIIINRIIENNGGYHSFKEMDLTDNKQWLNAYQGYAFVVGFLPKNNLVRINRLIDNENNLLDSKIHPLSKKLKKCINGYNNQLFYADGAVTPDGRFTTKHEEASVIMAFFDNPSKAIKVFKDIVVSYNNSDDFLSINNRSIVKLFDLEPDDVITFDVNNKFRLDLSKGNSYYRINMYPPGGIYGSWDDLNEIELSEENLPKVQFSQFSQQLKTKPIDINKMKEETNDQEKQEFLKNASIKPEEVTPASNVSKKSSNNFFWNLLWALLAIFMLSLLLRNCNTNQNYFEQGVNYFDSGNTDKGFKYLDKAINQDNQHIDALMRRGIEFMNVSDFKNAEYDFTEVITIDPYNWLAYYWRGRSYMEQAHNKWSTQYNNAIDDFTHSIEIEYSSLNSNSFYYRGEAKEIKLGERSGCGDFVESCTLELEKGCSKYEELCYPQTGYNPYKKYFGDGLFTGENVIYLDNTQSTTDALVIVRNINSGVKVRSKFIRKGEDITMNNIPNGNYEIKSFSGNNWAYNITMADGITKGGFTINQEFNIDNKKLTCFYCEYSMTLYDVEGGNLVSEEIDFNEFMK